jgi:ElaB/YqjD/DUF883 family membrane-anchored ribosome-binding protein
MAQQHTHKSSNQNNKDKDPTKISSTEIESQIGETRAAISDDIRVLSDKFSPARLKEEAKDAAKGVVNSAADAVVDKAGDAKDAVVDKAIEVKDVVVDKAIEVKDAVVEKAIEVKDKAVEVEQVVADKAIELKDDAAELLAEAKDVVVETLDDVGEQAKRLGGAAWRYTSANAVPLALVGIGAGWLIANAKRSSSEPSSPRLASRYTDDGDDDLEDELYLERDDVIVSDSSPVKQLRQGVTKGRPGRPAARASSTSRNGGPKRAASNLHDKASGLAAQASDAARTTKHKLEDGAAQGTELLRRRVGQGTEYVRQGVVRATDATKTFADNNPIALAMATLALGVGIGMILPASDRETKLLRPARERFDRFAGDAREAASDFAQIARETANESLDTLT